jgi:hypothetical protein
MLDDRIVARWFDAAACASVSEESSSSPEETEGSGDGSRR